MSGAYLFLDEIRSAVRARLLQLVKCTTGPIALAGGGNQFQRWRGSFVADRFTPGDEVTLGDGNVYYVRAVDELALTVDRPTPASTDLSLLVDTVAGQYGIIAPVTLSCALPKGVAWEDELFSPTDGKPYVSESVRNISSLTRGLGRGGYQAHTVSADFVVNYPARNGARGAELMAGAMVDLFQPGTALVYGSSSGTVMQAQTRPLLKAPDFIGVPVSVTVTGYTARV